MTTLPTPESSLMPARISTTDTRKDRFKGFVAGTASGITKCLVGHPFDTIKIRLQVSRNRFSGPWDCLRTTISKEGAKALYKGLTPPLLGWTFMDSIMLGSLTYYRHLISTYIQPSKSHEIPRKLSIPEHSLAGLGAGVTVAFVATPVEHIKARLQLQYNNEKFYSGPLACAKSVIRSRGFFLGLWTGLGATMFHRAFFCVWWGSYESFSRLFRHYSNSISEPMVNFFAGGLSANTYWLVCYPADCVKNKFMTLPLDISPRPSWISIARNIYLTEGFIGFYRGFLPCFLRAFPTNACALLAFETTMRALKK